MESPSNVLVQHILKWTLRGAILSITVMLLFILVLILFGAKSNENSLAEAWQLFPLVTGTLGGAFGGFFFGLLKHIWPKDWNIYLSNIIGGLAYLIIVWLSLILGFSAIGQWD